MKRERYLNVDIEKRIGELQDEMKEFLLKHKLYRILLRGKGLEFESYRDYSADDDAQSIDWKASRRTNKILVRQYRDERNLKIVFVIDVGKNMVFGSAEKLKCEYAAELIAALAHLVIITGDRVGFVLFNEEVKEFIPPKGGMKSFDILIDKITNPEIYDKASNLEKAFDFVYKYINPTIDSVVIVSDFISFDEKSAMGLSLVSKKFETLALMVRDPLDLTLPEYSEEVVIEDPKTGDQLLINPKIARQTYEKFVRKQEEFLRKNCLENNIDLLELITNHPFVHYLSEFLKGRTLGKIRK